MYGDGGSSGSHVDAPKNLIADPPCKVPNDKGFGGTCPLAPPCAQSYEMRKAIKQLNLFLEYVCSLFNWSWKTHRENGEATEACVGKTERPREIKSQAGLELKTPVVSGC